MMPRLRSVFVAFWSATCIISTPVYAERYSVEEDSFGGYSAKKVEQASELEPLKSAQKASSTEAPVAVVKKSTPIVESKPDPEDDALQDEHLGDLGKTLSPFEREYIKAEKERVLKAIKKGGAIDASSYDATKVDPLEYVDGDELLKKGARSASEPSRYYTVVDAEGRLRNVDYDPEAIKEALDKEQNNKIEFTEANVLHRSQDGVKLPESADPFAAKLLTKSYTSNAYFEQFAETCCVNLPNIEHVDLELGKSHYFDLNEEQLPYRFSGGDSRFLLMTLPETKKMQPVKLRSFIRRHKRFDIDHGVFFPQLVTLDKDRKPLRIFTGPLLKYHPETWLAHGYLEGLFLIDSTRDGGEKYILVNTTRDIQQETSSIENEEGLTSIEHMGIGTIELELLVEEP